MVNLFSSQRSRKSSVLVLLGVFYLSSHPIWLCDFGPVHWHNEVLESDREKSSSFLFVYYVTILIRKIFQMIC